MEIVLRSLRNHERRGKNINLDTVVVLICAQSYLFFVLFLLCSTLEFSGIREVLAATVEISCLNFKEALHTRVLEPHSNS